MLLDWDRFQHSQNGSGSSTTKSRRGPMQIRIHNMHCSKGVKLGASYLIIPHKKCFKSFADALYVHTRRTQPHPQSFQSQTTFPCRIRSLPSLYVVSRLPFVVLSNGLSLSSPLPYPSRVSNLLHSWVLNHCPASPSVSTSVITIYWPMILMCPCIIDFSFSVLLWFRIRKFLGLQDSDP